MPATTTKFTERELQEMFDELIDDSNPPIRIWSMHYDTSRVLKHVDPIAYRCAFLEWIDSEGYDYED